MVRPLSDLVAFPEGTGWRQVPDSPCDLVDVARLSLPPGERHDATTDDRELLVVIMSGVADVEVDGNRFPAVGGRADIFAGPGHSVYVPAGARWSVASGDRPVEAVVPSAPSDQRTEPYVIPPERNQTGVWGTANYRRRFRKILVEGDGHPARRLIVGETVCPSGNWATYPPHKHDVEDPPHEAAHEEIYFFKVAPRAGFGLAHHYAEGTRAATRPLVAVDETALRMRGGYHTSVSAPGHATWFLWALAGEHRHQAVTLDPSVAWVEHTVPMFPDA